MHFEMTIPPFRKLWRIIPQASSVEHLRSILNQWLEADENFWLLDLASQR